MQTNQPQLDGFLAVITNETLPDTERQVAARHYVELAVESIAPDTVADDDPGLAAFTCNPGDLLYGIYPNKTLAEKKSSVANERKRAAHFDIIGNETLPLVLRREAAARAQRTFPSLARTSLDQIVEQFTPHPHLVRLKELQTFISDRSPVEDIDAYLKAKREAIVEFRQLVGQYPKRTEGTPVLVNPEQYVAYWAKENSGQEREGVYSYALRQLGFSF
jgi:hypothetical protein